MDGREDWQVINTEAMAVLESETASAEDKRDASERLAEFYDVPREGTLDSA